MEQLAIFALRVWPWIVNVAIGVPVAAAGAATMTAYYHPEIGEAWRSFVVRWAAWAVGIRLDEDDPLSDASLCGAIAEKTGVVLSTLRDGGAVRADVERHVIGVVQARTGMDLSRWRNRNLLKRDILRGLTPHAVRLTGIPMTDLSDRAKIKSDVGVYLEERALVYIAGDLPEAKKCVEAALRDEGLGALAEYVKTLEKTSGTDERTGKNMAMLGAEKIVLALVADAIIAADERRQARVQAGVEAVKKIERRKAQLRDASARFRERHGHRLTYQRIGTGGGG